MTDFSKKVEILGEFYFLYKEDKDLKDFIDFNDLGLPLAYLASEGLCQITDEGESYILETWDLFMGALDIDDAPENPPFENLKDVFNKKGDPK